MNIEDLKKINSYLVFKLGDEEFAAHAGKVLHILELVRITEVPLCPAYMKGVINLRGAVLPVVDTRMKFGMSATEFSQSTCIVVVEIGTEGAMVELGALVDSVESVVEFGEHQVKPPSSLTRDKTNDVIVGMVEHNDKFMMVLDIDKLFSTDEIVSMKAITTGATTPEHATAAV